MTAPFRATTALACVILSVGLSRADDLRSRSIGSHSGGIASVHFSPDGKFLATGGGDKMIRIWNVALGKEVCHFPGPSSFTCAVRYSPDGAVLAVSGYETGSGNPIYLYDPNTGKEVARLDGHASGGVRRIEFSPDGKSLVSGGFDGHVRVWDLESRKELRAMKADGGTVYGIAISPDGKTIASAGRDGLRLWDLATGKESPSEQMNAHNCIAVAFSPDGKLLAAGDSNSVKLWEVATGKEVVAMTDYKGELAQVLFSRDGRTLYTGSYDRAVRLWEVRTGRLIHEAEGHTGWIWGIALSSDEKMLASCSVDTKVVCWDLAGLGRPTDKKASLDVVQMQRLLSDLSSNDAGTAYRAVCALASDPENSLPQLQRKLTAARVPAVSVDRIKQLLADLDEEEYSVRQRATVELEKAGPTALVLLKQTLANPPSLEVKRRVTRLLSKLDPTALPPEDLMALRGVQALEYIGNSDAKKLLEQLTQATNPRLAQEANQAIERMRHVSNR